MTHSVMLCKLSSHRVRRQTKSELRDWCADEEWKSVKSSLFNRLKENEGGTLVVCIIVSRSSHQFHMILRWFHKHFIPRDCYLPRLTRHYLLESRLTELFFVDTQIVFLRPQFSTSPELTTSSNERTQQVHYTFSYTSKYGTAIYAIFVPSSR